jgi:uncharacterized protein YacL
VPPHSTINLLRTLFVILAFCMGLMIGDVVIDSGIKGGIFGLLFGLAIVLADRLLKGISLRVFSSATFGLLIGFIFAQLLLASNILKYQSDDTRWMISLLVYSACGYLGMMLAIRGNRDEFALLIPYVRFRKTAVQDAPLLIDSNIVIDGRIRDLCRTGFVSNTLIVPRFVMDELHRLADSSEPQKRERGKRGLEELDQLQSAADLNITIHEAVFDEEIAVDAKLVDLAKLMQARLLTNDGNLCKIARLQGVQVLSLNELSIALRPSLASGEGLAITLVKEGRDPHQAVGYLADGTMIVVNQSREYIGSTVNVVISSTLQTSAGRMAFAELCS